MRIFTDLLHWERYHFVWTDEAKGRICNLNQTLGPTVLPIHTEQTASVNVAGDAFDFAIGRVCIWRFVEILFISLPSGLSSKCGKPLLDVRCRRCCFSRLRYYSVTFIRFWTFSQVRKVACFFWAATSDFIFCWIFCQYLFQTLVITFPAPAWP